MVGRTCLACTRHLDQILRTAVGGLEEGIENAGERSDSLPQWVVFFVCAPKANI